MKKYTLIKTEVKLTGSAVVTTGVGVVMTLLDVGHNEETLDGVIKFALFTETPTC